MKAKHHNSLTNQRLMKFEVQAGLLIVAIIFAGSACSDTPANTPADWRPYVPIPHPLTLLLRSQAVHEELFLQPAQILAAENAIEQIELPLWRCRDLPAGLRYEKTMPLINGLKSTLAQILTSRQKQRLDQLVLQLLGIEALFDDEISAQLNISPVQNQNMINTVDVYSKTFSDLDQNHDIPADQRKATREKLLRELPQAFINILDLDQRRLFLAMSGPAFDFSKIRMIAGKAPAFEKSDAWFNSTSPLVWDDLNGKVVVVHFYTYGCGNCIRNLPHYNRWYAHFPEEQFRIIGIHRPEKESEKEIESVKQKAKDAEILYPVAIDTQSLNWDSWANSIWPSVYLVDKKGFIRYWWYGELNWEGSEGEKWVRTKIQELIDEKPY